MRSPYTSALRQVHVPYCSSAASEGTWAQPVGGDRAACSFPHRGAYEYHRIGPGTRHLLKPRRDLSRPLDQAQLTASLSPAPHQMPSELRIYSTTVKVQIRATAMTDYRPTRRFYPGREGSGSEGPPYQYSRIDGSSIEGSKGNT